MDDCDSSRASGFTATISKRGRVGRIGEAHDEQRHLDALDEIGVLAQRLLGAALRGDVDHDAAEAHRLAAVVRHDGHEVAEVHGPSVRRDHPVLELVVPTVADGTTVVFEDTGAIVRMQVVVPEAIVVLPGARRVAEDVERRVR